MQTNALPTVDFDDVFTIIVHWETYYSETFGEDGLKHPPREIAYDLKRQFGEEGWKVYLSLELQYNPPLAELSGQPGYGIDPRGPAPTEAEYTAALRAEWEAIDTALPPSQFDRLLLDALDEADEYEREGEDLDTKVAEFIARHQGSGVLIVNQNHLAAVPVEPAPDLIQSSEEFVKAFVPPDYLIDGIFQRRYFYAVTAQTGVGKTAVALLLTALVGAGKKLGERDVEAGPVLYMAGENPDDVRARWIGLTDELGLPRNMPNIHFLPASVDLFENAGRISQEVARKGIEPALVVVDTAAAYNRGDDENSNAQQVNYARLLRSLTNLPGGPTVIVLCHPPKNATGEDALLPRGGGAFLAELDGNVTITKQEAVVTLRPGKFRGASNWSLSCELRSVFPPDIRDSKGRDVSTVIARPISDTEKKAKVVDDLRVENIVLKDVEKFSDDSLAERAARLCWYTKGGAPNKTKVDRTLRNLEADKLIERLRGDGWSITKKGGLELARLGLDGPPPGALHPMFVAETVKPITPPPIVSN